MFGNSKIAKSLEMVGTGSSELDLVARKNNGYNLVSFCDTQFPVKECVNRM